MSFVLEIYKPEQNFGTPTGGTTLIPLNSAWAGKNVSFAILEDDPFDLGNLGPQLSTYKSSEQFGERTKSYTHSDRELSFTVMVTATNFTDLKFGVSALQSALIEATQLSINDGGTANMKVAGYPTMLKYQPDSSVEARYFIIKSGGIETAQFNNQVRMLANIAYIPVKLRTSYAAYGPGQWLDNTVPNGSGHMGFKYWTFSDGFNFGDFYASSGDPATAITPKNWSLRLATADNVLGFNGMAYAFNNGDAPPRLIWSEDVKCGLSGLMGSVSSPSDCPTYFRRGAYGATNTLAADLADTYTRTNSATTMGNLETPSTTAYTAATGTWGILSNHAYSASNAAGDVVLFPGSNDNIYTVDVFNAYTDNSNYSTIGLVHRYLDSTNYATFYYNPTTGYGALEVLKTGFSTSTYVFSQLANSTAMGFNNTVVSLKIVSYGSISLYYANNLLVGIINFTDAFHVYPALVGSSANRMGYKLYKVGTSSGTYVDNMTASSTAVAYSQPVVREPGQYDWLDLEYRTIGTDAPSDLIVASLEVYDLLNPASVPLIIGTTLSLGGNTGGAWVRAKWSAAVSVDGSTSPYPSHTLTGYNFGNGYGYDGRRWATRVKLLTPMSKSCTASIEIRKVANWRFPSSDLAVLPQGEYMHQSYECRDTMILAGLKGDVETTARLKIFNATSYVNGFNYQKVTVGLRKLAGQPGPLVIDYGAATMNFNTGTDATVGPVLPGGSNGAKVRSPLPYSDFVARPYLMILIGSTNAACGVGLVANISGTLPYYQAVPNAYLPELPNTGSIVQAIDCGIVNLPSYNASSLLRLTPQWSLVFTKTPNTPPSTTFSITVNQVIFIPAEQVMQIDTRQPSGELGWYGAGTSLGTRALVIDSLLNDVNSYYYASGIELPAMINPSAPAGPTRLSPATYTSPYPTMFTGLIRRSGVSGAPATTIVLTDPVTFAVYYCPAYAL